MTGLGVDEGVADLPVSVANAASAETDENLHKKRVGVYTTIHKTKPSTESLTCNSFPIFYNHEVTPYVGEKKPAARLSGGFGK